MCHSRPDPSATISASRRRHDVTDGPAVRNPGDMVEPSRPNTDQQILVFSTNAALTATGFGNRFPREPRTHTRRTDMQLPKGAIVAVADGTADLAIGPSLQPASSGS
jgi:hypothetical protein